MMRIPLLLAFVCSISIGAGAQWTSDTQVNTPVRATSGLDALTPLMSDGPGGSTYISWFEGSPFQLRMQRLDAAGNKLWPFSGLVVSAHPQNSALFRYDLKTDHAGNAIVAFQDERSGELRVVVYKLALDGTFLWGADGIMLTDTLGGQGLAPTIGILDNNDVVIAWNGSAGNARYVPHMLITSNGTMPWGTPRMINDANYSRPFFAPRPNGGYFMNVIRETGNFPFVSTMEARAFDANGMPAGSTVISDRTTDFIFVPQAIPDGQGGFYVAFKTTNPLQTSLADVYVQRIRADLSRWSTSGTELLTGTSTQRFGGLLARVDDAAGLMAPVYVTDLGQNTGGWSIQRVDTAGVTQLGPNGANVVALSGDLSQPTGVAATADGCMVVFGDGTFGHFHLKVARVALDGTPLWGPPVLTLAGADNNKDDASCGSVVNGQLVAVWSDDRLNPGSGSGIYAQNVSIAGNAGPVGIDDLGQAPAGMAVLSDQGRDLLQVQGSAPGRATVHLFDGMGRSLAQWPVLLSGGTDRFELPSTLPPGAYVVMLEARQGDRTVRWLRQ